MSPTLPCGRWSLASGAYIGDAVVEADEHIANPVGGPEARLEFGTGVPSAATLDEWGKRGGRLRRGWCTREVVPASQQRDLIRVERDHGLDEIGRGAWNAVVTQPAAHPVALDEGAE